MLEINDSLFKSMSVLLDCFLFVYVFFFPSNFGLGLHNPPLSQAFPVGSGVKNLPEVQGLQETPAFCPWLENSRLFASEEK